MLSIVCSLSQGQPFFGSLSFSIILISLLVIVPIFTKYMYTTTLNKNDREIISANKIKEAEKSLDQMEKRLQSLKNAIEEGHKIIISERSIFTDKNIREQSS